MKKNAILTEKAPAPIGPYSQAVESRGMLYMSGQVAIDPATGIMSEGTLAEQAEMVMDNLAAVLAEASLGFSDVVKTTIFLAPGQDFGTVNEIYGKRFEGDYPARETVWVQQLPKNALVEISMLAAV